MIVVYNLLRALARFLVAAASAVLLTGKAEPFQIHFDAAGAVTTAVGLLLLATLVFLIEGRVKKQGGF